MKRAGLKILVIGLTALGLSAGVVAGMLVSRLPAAHAGAGEAPVTVQGAMPLAEQLGLNKTQKDQMQLIWENVRLDVQGCYQQALSLNQARDNEIIALLDDAQKKKFAEISKQYHDQDVKIAEQRQQLMAQAIERTRKLLTDDQRKTYDEILKKRLGKVPATGPTVSLLSSSNFDFYDATGLARENVGLGGIHD